MSILESIIAGGNRGHWSRENNNIVCADGFELSVIAGGGAYSTPRPTYCSCSHSDRPPPEPFAGEVVHDFPGPYTHVEVMTYGPASWDEYDSGGVYSNVPAEMVRALVAEHGGERP